MTNTAAPERATRIPTIGDRVIITTGTYDGHQGRIELVNEPLDLISVRMDVTSELLSYAAAQLLYPDGSRPETDEERRDRERAEQIRVSTLRRLHAHTRNLRPVSRTRASAIVMMAARYGAAERLKGGDGWDLDLSYSAADRRFKALTRLAYGDQ